MRLSSLVLTTALPLFTFGCGEAITPPASAPAPLPSASPSALAPLAPKARPPVEITLLYTSDEHGWISPTVEKGIVWGGAAELLGQLKAREGHCVGGSVVCSEMQTILLSGGDNFTGPAISSYFSGEPAAEAMGALGYAAIALGNHELDFGRPAFVDNRRRTHALYVAANVHASDPALRAEMELPPFTMIERRGAKIAIVGLATETTLTSAMASRFVGVTFEAEEPALIRAVPQAWAAGADAVVLIAHECPDKLLPILDRHRDWNLSFVGSGHCHKVMIEHSGTAPVIAPGWRFERYVRVPLTLDLDKPLGERARPVTPELVEVSHAEGDTKAPVDAALATSIAGWKTKLDRALGEEIGYTATGFTKDSTEIIRWIAGAYRAQLKTDVALINSGGIRQGLPKGAITKATLWSILPFDNKLVICKLKGRDLLADLETEEAAFAGVEKTSKGYRLEGGKAIEPEATYSVATIDFLYYGGSSFRFQKQDPSANETGIDWRTPVVEWMKQRKTTVDTPLERRIDSVGGVMAKAGH
jgi:5'-nucleotidase / UDP-sugar diphosphatase